MMIVSHFTLANDTYRGVSHHYRLLLTNLATRAYAFRLTLRGRHVPSLDQLVTVSTESDFGYTSDIFEAAGQHAFRTRFLIGVNARQTVKIQLRPFDVAAWENLSESMTARGYLELSIPPVATQYGGKVEPQGTEPVPVLLHPFEVDWASSTGYRDPAPITVSTGMAENEIVPEKPLVFEVPHDFAGLAEVEERRVQDTAGFTQDPRSIGPVLAYLGRVAESPEGIAALNGLLTDAGHGLRLERSRARAPRQKR